MEPTPTGRLAAVVRETLYRQYDTNSLPDYADLRQAMDLHVEAELLAARIDEARLSVNNSERIATLWCELMDNFSRQKLIQQFHERT